MISLSEYLKKNRKNGGRCLYVGKGPSAEYANKYRKFGDVCVINEASAVVKGDIDYTIVVDLERLEGMRADWHRIKTFFVPDKLFENGKVPASIPIKSVKGFPLEKAVIFPSNSWISDYKWSIYNSFRKGKLIFSHTATIGLHLLVLLGYDDFYILGNDGGVGYAKGVSYPKEMEKAVKTKNRDRKRQVLEYVCYLFSKKYKLKIRFWKPEDEKPIKIALLCPMRLGSSRLNSTILKKIGKYSLAERGLILMKKIQENNNNNNNNNVTALAAVGDKELIDLANKYKIKVLLRSQESLKTDKWEIRFKGWCEELKKQGFDFVLQFSACMPFMPIEEVQKAIDFLNIYKRDFAAVFENRGVLWDKNKQRFYPKQNVWDNTKTNDPYYTFCPTFSTWKPEFYEDFNYFYKTCGFLIVKKNMDYFDIHDEKDLKIAQAYFITLSKDEKKKLFLI